MNLASRRKIFHKNVFIFDLLNKFPIDNPYGFPDFKKVVLSFNIADLKDERNIMFYESLEILTSLTYQKAHVVRFDVKRRGPRVYLNFVSRVTLRGHENYYFIDFFLDYLLHYWRSNYFIIAKGLDNFANYNCAMNEVSYIPGLLQNFQYNVKWKHPIHISFSVDVKQKRYTKVYSGFLYKTFGFKLDFLDLI